MKCVCILLLLLLLLLVYYYIFISFQSATRYTALVITDKTPFLKPLNDELKSDICLDGKCYATLVSTTVEMSMRFVIVS